MDMNEKIREYLYGDTNIIAKGNAIVEENLDPNESLTKLIDKYGEFYICDFNRETSSSSFFRALHISSYKA